MPQKLSSLTSRDEVELVYKLDSPRLDIVRPGHLLRTGKNTLLLLKNEVLINLITK